VGWKHYEAENGEWKPTKVEREPMWDGNCLLIYCRVLLHHVEREPMWDGNNDTGRYFTKFTIVEREPMWDGNLICVASNMVLNIQLSENQCGMETF